MKLLKVTVPNFRNLKNVELTFEPGLQPSVFPISSENGGGKSTLLQLIFVLLYCSYNENKHIFLKNLLYYYFRTEQFQLESIDIANFEFLYKNELLNLRFSISLIDPIEPDEDLHDILLGSSVIKKHWAAVDEKKELQEKYEEAKMSLKEGIDLSKEIEDRRSSSIITLLGIKQDEYTTRINSLKKKAKVIQEDIEKVNKHILEDEKIEQIENELLNKGVLCSNLIDLSKETNSDNKKSYLFVCKTESEKPRLALEALLYLQDHIFLAAPPTQPYLFLSDSDRRSLLSNSGEYEAKLRKLNIKLPNLYIYNQLTISEIIGVFETARSEDWQQAVKTLEYGESFKKVVDDFHQFLGHNKYIFPADRLDYLEVRQVNSEGEQIQLSPEDLSHGELKRLGLYAWIKYNNINNSIVLIDEIENGLHPDWQYNIVRDLAEWGDNQYLLATHSFHLCEALTPKHVKEIEPKMVNPSTATEGQE